jgi:NAD(P)-dependent dehydrogenase (short-subunit alcohol dehydrogenase family)
MGNSGLLNGRVAAVMGGADGIGLACVKGLLAEGASVLMADINEEKGRLSAGKLKDAYGDAIEFRKADVSRSEEVNAAIEHVAQARGGLDVLVNVVGINVQCPVEKTTDEDFARMVNTNLRGTLAGIRAAVPHLKRRGGGSIVGIGSVHGECAFGEHQLYMMCKAGLNGMAKELAFTLGPDRIRVNVVAPGYISPHRGPADVAAKLKPEAVETFWKEWAPVFPIRDAFCQPLWLACHAADVADAVVFLASDKSRFITGEVLHVDGGLSFSMFRFSGRQDYVSAVTALQARWDDWFARNKAQ